MAAPVRNFEFGTVLARSAGFVGVSDGWWDLVRISSCVGATTMRAVATLTGQSDRYPVLERYACHRLAGGEPFEIVAHADKLGDRIEVISRCSTAVGWTQIVRIFRST